MADRTFFDSLMASNRPYSERCPLSDLETLIRRRRNNDFVFRLIDIFNSMREQNLMMFQHDDQQYFAKLFELWFSVLEKPSFEFPAGSENLFHLNGTMTNILAVTDHRNGDECLKKVLGQSNNLAKVLLLYTPRSQLRIDVKSFFDAHPQLASLWYSSIWNWVDTYAHPVVHDNCRYFMENFDDRFIPFDSNLVCAYFRCTYVDNERDILIKRRINESVRRYCSAVEIINQPKPKSVAVVSAYWDGKHAVYRAFAPYVEALRGHYHLTLVHLGQTRKPEASMFDRVFEVTATSELINIKNIQYNDFQIAYYPDVGMSQESMYLSNIRLAPIQALTTGHPVSTGNSTIDYFISGGEVEMQSGAEANYDERLVLLPGISVHPVRPDYVPVRPTQPKEFLINCPWMHMKINYPILLALKKIKERAGKPVIFQFFPGNGMSKNSAYMATIQDLAQILGTDASQALPDMPYHDYMKTQEYGRFTLHSYPFGGGTTAVDALILGKPLVVWQGKREYNRYSATLLRRIGLGELVANSEDEFVDISLRLVDDDAYRESVTNRVREANLDDRLFRVEDASCLRRAFDTLTAHHGEIQADKSRQPVRVK